MEVTSEKEKVERAEGEEITKDETGGGSRGEALTIGWVGEVWE